jgi:sugar lactone lactonase YvrE
MNLSKETDGIRTVALRNRHSGASKSLATRSARGTLRGSCLRGAAQLRYSPMSLLHPNRPSSTQAPHLDRVAPRAAIPGGSFEIFGSHLFPVTNDGPQLPSATFGDTTAYFDLVRPGRALLRVPEGAIASDLTLRANGVASNVLHANIAVPMADELHLVSNPTIDGNLFAMISGPRGERVPVSIVRIGRDLQARPFARDLLNVTALAFGPDSYLYASSRAEGTVYRISPEGDHISTFAEGMGVATGIAFDRDGNLFVGDRSGTIFKVGPYGSRNPGEVFVFATLEPSVAAYHLAFRDDGTLLVAAPSTSSNQPIYAIAPNGDTSIFYQGLGRPQGLALDSIGNVYVAASLQGRRGIVRITPDGSSAELFIAGNDLVGLCFLDDGCAALATNGTLFHLDLGITGRALV